MTGWNMPPGCNVRDIPGAMGDEPCQCCGHDPADCICQECPVCHVNGNPDCYIAVGETPQGMHPSRAHGLKYNRHQRIGQAKMKIHMLKDQIADEEQFLAWAEDMSDEDFEAGIDNAV